MNLPSSKILHFITLKRAPLDHYTSKKSIIEYNTHCDWKRNAPPLPTKTDVISKVQHAFRCKVRVRLRSWTVECWQFTLTLRLLYVTSIEQVINQSIIHIQGWQGRFPHFIFHWGKPGGNWEKPIGRNWRTLENWGKP